MRGDVGEAMRFRGTTIRRKIVALLLIPLVSLTATWAFTAFLTGRALLGRPDVKRVLDNVAFPTNQVVNSLQQERRVAMVYIADPHDAQAHIALDKQEQATDAAIAKLRTKLSASGVRKDIGSRARESLDAFLGTLQSLPPLRQRLDKDQVSRMATYDGYNSLFGSAYDFFDQLLPMSDVTLDIERRAVIGLNLAREEVSRQDALMAAAISTGHMSQAELTAFTFAVGNERNYYDTNLNTLDAKSRAPYDAYWKSAPGRALRSAQDRVIDAGPADAPIVANQAQWQTVAANTYDDLARLDTASTAEFTARARPLPKELVDEAIVTGGLGLVAVVASLIVSIRIGRGLIRDLTGLRREAQEVSGTRLPRVMRRLASGEQVDIETEVPRLQYADDEIGQVGTALNTLQRAAVEAAVRQADMRKGVSDVFVNLARRSQVLLHRQLTLLDAMERRTENPEELSDLFRLDHMTTRMRRHAEGLVILSGAAPSRQWRKPVQLMDVVRAAVAEVEDYERVEVRRLPRLAVTGSAVADLTHLLAELIENAAVFSPPHTQVKVHGEGVANGFVLEIDDRGLGLTPDLLLEANLRLAETPEFELSDTDRLGLFVVSRLAQRHGVRVSLRQSPYGGTTAVVLVPAALLTETDEDTGATRLGEAPEPFAPQPFADTEHTFRQWGMDGVGADPHKEHAAHADEPAPLPDPGAGGPVPLPRRRTRTTPVLVADRGRPVGDRSAADGGPRPDQGPDGPRRPDPAPWSETARRGPAVAPSPSQGRPQEPGRPHAEPRPQPLPPVQSLPTGRHAAPAGPPDDRLPGRRADRAAPAAPADGGSALPRRVRQANLAPQLRQSTPAEAAAEAPGRERSADEVRDRMAALQRGWQRGRRIADADGPADPYDEYDESSTSAPRTTPEGNGR